MNNYFYLLTNDRDTLLVDNSTGQEMKVEVFAVNDHSVTSVVATLKLDKKVS